MYASIDETKDVIQPNTDESQFFSAKDTKQYYDYQNIIKCETKIPYDEPYEKKLRTIPNVIYPEYKKGGKSIHELANYYQIEAYLIEEYIEKVEQSHNNNKWCKDVNKDKIRHEKRDNGQDVFAAKIVSLEKKVDTLEEKIDHIIDIIKK